MAKKHNSSDPIPTRRRPSQLVTDIVAAGLFDKLVGGWGLINASKIVVVLTKMIKDEKKRRRKLEDKP